MPPDLSQFVPEIGVAEDLGANIRRIVAPNPSPMTYRGTNTYLLGKGDLAVIDPGPDNQAHLAAILRAVGPHQRISHILVTHAHVDHSPFAAALSRITAAPVFAYGDATNGRSKIMQRLSQQGLAGGGEGIDMSFILIYSYLMMLKSSGMAGSSPHCTRLAILETICALNTKTACLPGIW